MFHQSFTALSDTKSIDPMDLEFPDVWENYNNCDVVDSDISQSPLIPFLENEYTDYSDRFGTHDVFGHYEETSLQLDSTSVAVSKGENSCSTNIPSTLTKKFSKKIQKLTPKKGSVVIKHKRNCDRDFNCAENPKLKPNMVTFRRFRGKPLKKSEKKMSESWLPPVSHSSKPQPSCGVSVLDSNCESHVGSEVTFSKIMGSQESQSDMLSRFKSLKDSNKDSETEVAENLNYLDMITSTIRKLGLLPHKFQR